MSLLEQVQTLTSLHQYWHGIGTPSSQAISDRIEQMLQLLLTSNNNPNS